MDRKPELRGKISPENIIILKKLFLANTKIENEFKALKKGPVRTAVASLFTDLSSVMGTIGFLCDKQPSTPSLVHTALLRTLIESMISIFAFCKAPKERAQWHYDFRAVLDWKFSISDQRHTTCPIWSKNLSQGAEVAQRRAEAEDTLRKVGAAFLRNNDGSVADAITNGNIHGFRERWYPENRREILIQEGMGWVYSVFYERFCSAVHCDSAGSIILSDLKRDHVITWAISFWGAGIWKLIDTLRIHIPADDKGLLHLWYKGLQG